MLCRDEEGKPILVFHGTDATFEEFDPDMAGKNYLSGGKKGLFFTSDPHAASCYAVEHAGAAFAQPPIPGLFAGSPATMGNGGANVVAAYLKMSKPLVVKVRGLDSPDIWFDRNQNKVYSKADAEGCDGIIVHGPEHHKHRSMYVVFDASQVVFKTELRLEGQPKAKKPISGASLSM